MAKEKEKDSIEDTMNLHINENRINDAESLDTSFLEGRAQKKVSKDTHEKEKLLKESHSIDFEKIFRPIGTLLFLCLLAVGGYYLFTHYEDLFHRDVKMAKEEKVKEKIVYRMDDNYLFIGDYHTEKMDLEGFSYPYVKVSDENMTTTDILEDMKNSVYDYNPSVVVIELGMVDLVEQEDEEVVLSQIATMIQNIQKNRKYAEIYVESLYPIDTDDKKYKEIDMEFIIQFNEKLKEKVTSLNASYIDICEPLTGEGKLEEYLEEDGITLNETGYERVLKVLKKEFVR